ncbi:MAG: DUF5069 domain-containing protein [Verrucomicrobia bacterium]|nr:DUF5069 domain-containing protein [Verrucomicrobiota bacterium]
MKTAAIRSPYDKTSAIVYFGRMLDKIRLNAQGALPQDYIANLGEGFDLRCVDFLKVSYADLCAQVLAGASDEAALEWCFSHGRRPSEEEIEVWNEFMRKRGWNDVASGRLKERLAECGFSDRTDIHTFFDFIDLDEGRL